MNAAERQRSATRACALGLLTVLLAGCGLVAGAPRVRDGASGWQALRRTSSDLWVMPEQRDTELLQLIRAAQSRIRMEAYMLTHKGLIEALLAARARDVAVEVMLEEKPYNPGNPNKPLTTNQEAFRRLSEGGVSVRWTNPAYRFTHAKWLLIDASVAVLGTANFTQSGLGVGGKGAREYLVVDRDAVRIRELNAIFDADWKRVSVTPQSPDLVVAPVNARQNLLAHIRSARRELDIQVEVAGDAKVEEALIQQVQQGVSVRVLLADLDRGVSQSPADGVEGAEPSRGNREVAVRWRELGMQVKLQKRPHLHAKLIRADEKFYIGSNNLTTNSLDANREIGLISDRTEWLTRLKDTFNRDFGQASAPGAVAPEIVKFAPSIP